MSSFEPSGGRCSVYEQYFFSFFKILDTPHPQAPDNESNPQVPVLPRLAMLQIFEFAEVLDYEPFSKKIFRCLALKRSPIAVVGKTGTLKLRKNLS